jgi:FkbM family methyltransferase
MKLLKSFTKRYLFGVLATIQLYPVFKILHRISLWGMNVGLGGLEDTGESHMLQMLSKNTSKNTSENFLPLIFFDVGSNQGQFAKLVIQSLGKKVDLFCFEPSKKTFHILKQNLDGFQNANLYNFGLGDCDQFLNLYADKEMSRVASLYDRKHFDKSTTKLVETVGIKSLDKFCSENAISHIHYLKLDVEGHELSVLRGAVEMLRAEAIDYIQFEFGGCNIDSRTYLRDFFEVLSPNYDIFRLLRNGLAPIKTYHETLEIFTTTNFVAKLKIL